jgi:ABC-2 type transport system ATP-binding protein
MWDLVRELRASGVTIILTTHYIEEAQEMADRIGVINKGEIVVVEEKAALMRKLGKKQLKVTLAAPLSEIPADLVRPELVLSADGRLLTYSFDTATEHSGIAILLKKLGERGIEFNDLQTKESSLEDIFVTLVGKPT